MHAEHLVRTYATREQQDNDARLLASDGWAPQDVRRLPPHSASREYVSGRWSRGWMSVGEPPDTEIVVTYTRPAPVSGEHSG